MKITMHCYAQNTKSLDLAVSDEKVVLCFPIVCLWELMTPVRPFYPRDMAERIYVEPYITLGFVEQFLCIALYKPMADNHAPGCGLYGLRGYGWQDL